MTEPRVCHRCDQPVGSYLIDGIEVFGGAYIERPEGPEHLNGCMETVRTQKADGTTVITSRFMPLSAQGIDGDTPIYF